MVLSARKSYKTKMKTICHIVNNISGREKKRFVFVTLSLIISFSFSVKMVRRHVCEFGYSSPVGITSFLLDIKNRGSCATAMCGQLQLNCHSYSCAYRI